MSWWLLWYAFLGLLIAPFVALALAFLRVPAGETSAPLDKAFALTSVAWFGLMGAVILSSLLWTAATRDPGVWSYIRNGAITAVLGVGLGLLVGFPACMYVASHTYPMKSRRQALMISLLVAAGFLAFSAYATRQFQVR